MSTSNFARDAWFAAILRKNGWESRHIAWLLGMRLDQIEALIRRGEINAGKQEGGA